MSEKRIIAVVGATGAQGGGLARAILEVPEGGFAVRALTRDPSSEKGRALADAGADVVAADLDDEESLARALEGAHGGFFVTNFWEHFSPEREYAQAGNLARAAKRAGLAHVIWSTLEDTRRLVPLDDDRMPTLMGRYKVPHFDAKGAADDLFREAGVPTTFLRTSFYWDNFVHFGSGPAKGPDGRWAITMPMGDGKLPGIAVEDIGRCAYGIFLRGDELVGKTVAIAGEHLTGEEMAEGLSRALGIDVVYHAADADAYRELGFPGAEDLGNMFQYKRDFQAEFCGPRDPSLARSLNPRLQTFDAWLAIHAHEIPLDG